MKRILSIAAACLVLVIPILGVAAEPDSVATAERRPNSLQAGAWALQYVSSDFLSYGTIYFKRHLRDDRAIRFGAYFSGDTESHDLATDTTQVQVESGWEDRDSYSVSLEAMLQQYADVTRLAHVFLAFGGYVGVSTYTVERQIESDIQQDYTRKIEQDTWNAGGLFIVGAEWFASRALSIDMEYRVRGGYRSLTSTMTDTLYGMDTLIRSTDDASEWYFDGGNAVVGIGIYF